MQRAAQCNVVDIVTGGPSVGAGLTPAGHASEHQLWIARQHDLRPQPEPLHYTGTEAFDEHIGFFAQSKRCLHVGGSLQIQCHGAPPAGFHGIAIVFAAALAIDAQHVGTQIAEQHAAERRGPDARKFQYFETAQRSSGRCHCLASIDSPAR